MGAFERLQDVFREVFDQPDLGLDAEMAPGSLDGWDSVQTVQLVLAIEQEFGIRFSTEDVASIQSAASIIEIVDKHLKN